MPSAKPVFKTLLASERDTLRLAGAAAERARGGEVVALRGELGSGKTVFVRGFLRALGWRGPVRSPTFALIHEYRRLEPRVHHLDLYRLKPRDLPGLGLGDILGRTGSVCLIEWPEAAEDWLPSDRLEVVLSHADGGGRALSARARGPRARRLLAAWRTR
ncbi:MAG: tRNA (adenosine(37)-N6)-threonylcarbamoyltransferase complex ATPase subunit type 1 TsaE [Elusimicrobiota bacterium]|jgi:tRNA threonylcarbamoyladenosine biosynthesis protein TsaE